MKTSKLFITSLLAAAAMGTSAYAGFVWNGGAAISPDLWRAESSWTLTDGTTWPTGGTGPLTPNSDAWNGVTVANASGTVDTFEGWALGLTLQNADLRVTNLNKFQTINGSGCTINLDKTSTLSMTLNGNGRLQDNVTVNTEGVFNLALGRTYDGGGFIANLGNSGVLNFTSTGGAFKTKVSTLNATLNITDFDSYTIDDNGNTVYTRNLITLSGNVSFDTNTTTTETMTAGAGVGTLTDVGEGDIFGAAAGSYKVTKDSSGYSVSYVVAGRTYAWNATAAGSVWDTVTANWTTDGGSTSATFTDRGNVFFGAGETLAKTVAINSAVTAGTISVADNYTFNVGSGGSLAGTFFVAADKTATLNLTADSSISAGVSSGVVKKTGSSALTYSGTISSGATLEIAEGGTISVGENGRGTLTGANVFSGTLNDGGTLNISGGVTKVTGDQKLNGNVVIASGATLYSATTDAVTYNYNHAQTFRVLGTLQLDARWTLNTAKKLVLAGGTVKGQGATNQSINGITLDYYNGGTIVAEAGSTGSKIESVIAVGSNYSLEFETNADLSVSGNICGYQNTGASISKTGAGTLTLSGTNSTYSNGTTISAGKLVAARAGALGTGAVTVNGDGSILDFAVSGGTFTQDTNQALTTTGAGKITVSAGTLALTGAVNLSNAIEVASGASVTTSGVKFALSGLTGTANGDGSTTFRLFTLASGAALTWDSLNATNLNFTGTNFIARGASATFNSDGTMTFTDGTAGNLVWNGTTGNSTWNYTATNTNWKIGDGAAYFQNKDNVTFKSLKNVVTTVTLENGANLAVGDMTVEGGDYTLNAGAGNSATISGATLTVASGASLQLSSQLSGDQASALRLGFDNISVAGTLKVYTNSTDTWSKLTFADSGSGILHLYDIGGDANTTGLTISTMQMDAAGLLTAYWGGRVAISALTGSGDLTIKKPAQSSTTYAIGSLANYTGTLSMEGSGQELTVLLTENNTGFTGNVKVSTGILGVNNSNALGSGTLTLNGGTLRADANNLSFANAVNVTAASIINTKGNTLTLTSVTIADGKALQVLNSAAPSGATTIDSLTVSGASATVRIGTAANDGGNSHHGRILIKDIAAGTGTLNLELKANTSARSIFELGASDVDSTGAFTGTIAFSGSNSGANRSGSLVISNGTVASNAEISLASTVSTGAILSLGVNASSVTIGGLSSSLGTTKAKVYSGAIELGSEYNADYGDSATSTGTTRSLVIDAAEGKNFSFNGEILKNLNLEKTGAGTQTLAGASATFNGTVTISQGVLALADAAAIGTGNTVRIAGGQLKVGNGTTAVSLNAAAYTIVLSDAYSETSGTGVAAIVGTDETTSKSSVALKTDTKITIELADSVAVSLAAEAAQYQYKIFDVATIAADSFSVDDFVLAEALQGTWQISYKNGVLTLTIPEPSVFGLLAGLGALALAGTRRRRRKA